MEKLTGNCVVAQSGGPTAVINASLCGVVQEASKYPEIKRIYGAHNGILGVLLEEFYDLTAQPAEKIEALKRTPSAAVGSCRYKLKDPEKSKADYERIMEVFKAHDVRYFFYAGGNDSMDTADKLVKLAAEMKYDIRIMGIPKTIDNDLAETDHCPGYGSVIKYLATSVMEAGRDTESLYTSDTATVFETMGRNAGWIAAGTALAARSRQDAPHLIYLPEVPFSLPKFIEDVKGVLRELGRCFIVVGEGLVDDRGQYVTAQSTGFAVDAFGHRQLGGVGELLQQVVEKEVGVKCRYNRLGTCQRQAIHFASLTDSKEAYMAGVAAVRQAVHGKTGFMISLVRASEDPYKCTTGLATLRDVANGEKKVPRNWINAAGNFPGADFISYARPLIRGEVRIQVGDDGLPVFVRFEKNFIPKRTGRDYKPGG